MSYRVSPTPWSLPIISKLASCVAHYHRLQVKVLELSSYWLRCWLAVKPTPFPYRVGGCLRHAVSVSHCVTLHCNSCCRRRQLAPTTSVSPCLSLPLDDDLARDLLDLHSCQCGIIQALSTLLTKRETLISTRIQYVVPDGLQFLPAAFHANITNNSG